MEDHINKDKITNFRKRFGPEYFRRVPSKPGVFWMIDAKRNWLFIGKSKNIKERLQAFRYERKPELSALIHNINWSQCPDIKSSEQLYKELLLKHHPPFNKAHQSDFSYFIRFKISLYSLTINHGQPQPEMTDFTHFNLPFAQKITAPLIRSIWYLVQPKRTISLPSPLTKDKLPPEIQIPLGHWHSIGELERGLYDLLDSANIRLLESFAKNITFLKARKADPVLTSWLEKDLKELKDYFLHQMMSKRF